MIGSHFRGWRAEPDSNRLPSAVLADALPKAPPARITRPMAGCLNRQNERVFYPQLRTYSNPDVNQLIRWPSWDPCTGVNAGIPTGGTGQQIMMVILLLDRMIIISVPPFFFQAPTPGVFIPRDSRVRACLQRGLDAAGNAQRLRSGIKCRWFPADRSHVHHNLRAFPGLWHHTRYSIHTRYRAPCNYAHQPCMLQIHPHRHCQDFRM